MKPSEKDFQIDQYNLDEEWIQQPDLYRRYAEELADAKQTLEEAKNNLAVIRAEMELDYRKNPDPGMKVTEAVIKAAVEVMKEVTDAEAAVVEAKHEVAVLEAAVTALDHRKRALSDLVSLFLSDYYSKPTSREDDGEVVADWEKKKARKGRRRERPSED